MAVLSKLVGHIIYTKGVYMVPFRVSTERAPTKTKKTPLVI